MKILLLLRHAKSENAVPGMADCDRAVNDRGRKEAQAIGKLMQEQNVRCDLVLSSPARRARETTELVLSSAQLTPEVRYDQQIYEASPLTLLEVVATVSEEHSAVLVVGHNPGIEELLQMLTNRAEHMATGTLAKIDLEGDGWGKVEKQKGKLNWIMRPTDLP